MAKGIAITLGTLALIGIVFFALILVAPNAVMAGVDYIICGMSGGDETTGIGAALTPIRTELATSIGSTSVISCP